MWLQKGAGLPTLVPDTLLDTITRCLGDGWVPCADPRAPLPPEPAVEAEPDVAVVVVAVPAEAVPAGAKMRPHAATRPKGRR